MHVRRCGCVSGRGTATFGAAPSVKGADSVSFLGSRVWRRGLKSNPENKSGSVRDR